MSFSERLISLGELDFWPDIVSRQAIRKLVAHTATQLERKPVNSTPLFARDMDAYPIALHAADANAQHYEIPPAFFKLVLGPRRKYSCCLFENGATDLAAAEEQALAQTAANALLADGQDVLELGCGWGAMSLWMARKFPGSRIVAVSNSRPQRSYIVEQAEREGLKNLVVTTADMNAFSPERTFDRIVSIEMFEHMANWNALLSRLRGWLHDDGFVHLHFFSHRYQPYRFDHTDPADWIARHFFTGGIMPSHALIHEFSRSFSVDGEWRWSGENYRKTADAWLKNFDQNSDVIDAVLNIVYGAEARLWKRRWRLFFLATSELFGYGGGEPWAVSHFRLRPAPGRS